MDHRDARTLNQEAQEELRRQAIRLLKSGMSQKAVAEQIEVSRMAVHTWWKRYREGGWSVLKKRRRGRSAGEQSKLSAAQEEEVQRIITDKRPDQLKLKFALWNRQAVRSLIEEKFGVTYTLQNLSYLLKRWGFTPQRPLKRAYEQRPAEVTQWLKETYPKVKARAQSENAEIWWGDETAVKPECHYRRGYSPKGKTPVVRQPAKRFHCSLISAVNNRGKMQWMALKDALNADTFIRFLKQLIKHRKRKLILIVDNLRVHHSKPVKAWVKANANRIELVFLPPYSPELNPDEYLNNYLKQTVTAEGPPTEKEELDFKVWISMLTLNMDANLVASFFRHPDVKYAA